jgi:hypothetical protein
MNVIGLATIQVVIGGDEWAMQLPPAVDLMDTETTTKLVSVIEAVKGLLNDG